MTFNWRQLALYGIIAAAGIAAPFVFPAYTLQITVMWVMILFAVTWDILGGQMGYNSLGNIFFFGVGMYTSAIVQIGLVYDVAKYASPVGGIKAEFTPEQYFTGLVLGFIAAALVCGVFAVILAYIVFGLRGPYFAIGTLGVGCGLDERFKRMVIALLFCRMRFQRTLLM